MPSSFIRLTQRCISLAKLCMYLSVHKHVRTRIMLGMLFFSPQKSKYFKDKGIQEKSKVQNKEFTKMLPTKMLFRCVWAMSFENSQSTLHEKTFFYVINLFLPVFPKTIIYS